ncbi:MAG: hypothetical protein WD294_08410, partial [Phycisphaeraceae bacterium]
MKLTSDDFTGQFVLTKGASPEGWAASTLAGWKLASHPNLPVYRVLAQDQSQIGWLIGHAIDEDAELIGVDVTLPIPHADVTNETAVERFIYSFGGRFAAIGLPENYVPAVVRVGWLMA